MKERIIPILFAILAACFYALNIPLSKVLMEKIPPTLMAGLLYLGAGIGIGVMFLYNFKKINKEDLLGKNDTIYVFGMIILDIIAPIMLMYGIKASTSGNAALLNNFEIVATSIIALFIFKETISKKLWIAIILVTLSSAILTFDASSLKFSYGSFLVLGAATCWGLENNCTTKISSKNTYEIVTIKGFCCGIGSIVIGLIIGERFNNFPYIIYSILLGYVAYGLSIFFYIKAQNIIGAAKTSAFYAINPFIAIILSFIIYKELPMWNFYVALKFMIIGTGFIIFDTLEVKHIHNHIHEYTHIHDGVSHTHVIEHSHIHIHYLSENKHNHTHKDLDLHALNPHTTEDLITEENSHSTENPIEEIV
ncbi:DMT superfamily drug/metabolite transporter [Anaeromyces robustus]|uniref:DMT superfamily drug/metabolite transporter n=1 Tax=Anaeromyces robustus TaxID=1754192 RepID=A0A1Y1XDY9_9FUNG|nr:DMT superfamily drug/metabolite transporter [Anaeromyces robustus]|eukprot:ORX83666.1 DMT superfamily drug/metabolite transporter [Anaeromyces robustus]